jgi:2-C-methyl-D-erythritol 2,4-cyclodiphosphate synthase
MRIGNAFDVHPLVVGRALVLGGISIPFELGLEGHSDGDALTHAVIDSLLGAAGLGDIGVWFPPTDPKWKGANSIEMLRVIMEQLKERNWKVGNVDSVIICERPKLSPYFAQIRQNLAKVLEVTETQVSVKATTSEGLGFVGREEAIAVHAVALIEKARPLNIIDEITALT